MHSRALANRSRPGTTGEGMRLGAWGLQGPSLSMKVR